MKHSDAATRYVDDSITSTPQDGTSWNTCFKYLQDALDASSSGDTIRVAGGSHRPDQDSGSTGPSDPDHVVDDRDETFTIKTGVTVVGGYAGLALPSTPNVRNTILYPTHLTGEIGNTAIVTDNSRQVVTVEGTASLTVLDSLIIEYGYADHNSDTGVGIAIPQPAATPNIKNCAIQFNTNINNASHGAGIFITGDQLDTPDVTLENCTFNFNYASNGSSIACRYANPKVKDCLFSTNAVAERGGAIWLFVGTPTAKGSGRFENCIIADNVCQSNTPAALGGGVYCEGKAGSGHEANHHPTFHNCQILGNLARNGGGMYVAHANMDVIGCTFDSNAAVATIDHAAKGGGMFVDYSHWILDTYFGNNYTMTNKNGEYHYDGYGGGLFAAKQLPLVVNSLFFRNTSGVGGGMYGNGEISQFFEVNFMGVNCTFADNTAITIGGGYAGNLEAGSTPTGFINSIFWNNVIPEPATGVTIADAQIYSTSSGDNVTYSCIMDDDADDSSIPFGGSTNNNIDDDPLFREPILNNYRLKRCSPAIDAASSPDTPQDELNLNGPLDTNTTCGGCEAPGEHTPDLDLRRRVTKEPTSPGGGVEDLSCMISCGWIVDMGSYEFGALPCEIMGDLTNDGRVDAEDLVKFNDCRKAGLYDGGCNCGDMNGNGVLDDADQECLAKKILAGTCECDGMVICEEGSAFTGGSSANSAEQQGQGEEQTETWASMATAAVTAATSASALQGGAGESSGVDGFEMAARWIAFEQWVSANPVESFPGSQAAYDAWARVKLTRIVQEGEEP